jgi:hypothetical protein
MSEEVKDDDTKVVELDKTPKDEPKTFTQEDIDKVVAERLTRERKKYTDYDELKTKVSEYEKKSEERRVADLSEKEKAEELTKKAQEERDALTKELEQAKSAVKSEKIRTAFITSAQKNGVEYLDDAYKLADLSSIEVTEDGSVAGIDDVVKALVEAKPFLAAKAKPTQIGRATNDNHDQSDKTGEQLLADARDKARSTQRTEDKVAYAKLKRELAK